MTNDEIRMTNQIRMTKSEGRMTLPSRFLFRHSDFVIDSSFWFRYSDFLVRVRALIISLTCRGRGRTTQYAAADKT
jgi:hypothetical protein